MIELITLNTIGCPTPEDRLRLTRKNRKLFDEYESTFCLAGQHTYYWRRGDVAVVSQWSLQFVWQMAVLDVARLYPEALSLPFPAIAAVCLKPQAYDAVEERQSSHDHHRLEEYGMTDEEWNERYKSGGHVYEQPSYPIQMVNSQPVFEFDSPTWVIVVRGWTKRQCYYTLRHEMKHVIELTLGLPIGTTTTQKNTLSDRSHPRDQLLSRISDKLVELRTQMMYAQLE